MLAEYDDKTKKLTVTCPLCLTKAELDMSHARIGEKIDFQCDTCNCIVSGIEVGGNTYKSVIDQLRQGVILPDMVNHPPHYQSETGLEVIDVIEAFTFDLKGIEAICTGNALKYMCRWKQKNGLEDLKKAEWYINRLIKHFEKLEKENDQS